MNLKKLKISFYASSLNYKLEHNLKPYSNCIFTIEW